MSGGKGGSTLGAGGAGGTIDPTTGAPVAGSPGATSQTNAAGGGGGSAGGGAGGAGAHNIIGFNLSSTGGTGGTGGSNAIGPVAVSTGSNAMSRTAGNGTQGTTGDDAVGGGGGEGGYGLILTGSGGAFSNTGVLTGGTGGNAVDGAVGGDGGIAIDVLASGVTLTNSAALTGGNAGTGSQTTYTNGNPNPAVYGKGGAAIAGANLTINDSANLTGGLNGDGTQGAAIDFTGGANTLSIANGTTVTGGIIDTGSLALQGTNTMSQSTYAGISGTGSVDVSKGNVVQLTGDNTYTGGTTVEGDLTLGLHSSDPTGNIVLTGSVTVTGNLDVQVSSGSTATLGAVSGSGNFRISGNAIVASDTIANTVNDSSSNLTLTGGTTQSITNYGTLNLAPTGTTPTTVTGSISNAGTLNLAPTGAGALTISGVISDGDFQAGTVVAKSGTTILSGTNTYSGATYLQGGVIDAENASAFGTGTVYAVDPEIDYGPASGAVGKRVLSATQANAIVLDVGTLAASDPTILKVASGFTETISGAITTGSGTNSAGQTTDPNQPLLVNGAGTLVLSGANSFSGGTTLGGSGTLELDSATAAGATSGTGTDGAVTFATGSTATLRIDVAATTEPTDGAIFYANPISNFAYGETIDLVGLQYEVATEGSPITATAALSGGTLTVTNAGFASESLTSFADAAGQSGQFTTASDGNGGTLVTLVAPPPAAPTNLIEKGTATNGGTVEITGTATGAGDANGDTITLYADGGTTAVGTGMVANGVFDITTTATFADGSHTFTATETSATTNETSANSGGSTLYSFTGGADGSNPQGVLFADAAGNLIGTATYGGSNNGTIFEIANISGSASAPVYAGAATTLYTFTGEGTDGAYPRSGLVADANGDLFGTTSSSGDQGGGGTVFEVANTGTTSAPAYGNGVTTLATIGSLYTGLQAGLAIDAAGDLFGTTARGGANGNGTVFELAKNANGSYATTPTTLYSFTGQGTDGARPQAGLIADAAGDLFGTTARGGANGNGTVFELAKNANGSYATTPTTLYSFTGQGTDGASPQAGLIADTAGDLFGTTARGGANGYGTVFELAKSANGSYATTTLASLGAGANPAAALTIDAAGNLYGTTGSGGAGGDGTVFEIVKNANGTYATAPITLHSFTGQGSDGFNPAAGLLAIAGALYGTTASGGANGVGTVFETIPTGIAPVLIAALPPTLTAVSGTASNGGTLEVQGTTPDAVGDTITLYNGTTVVGTGTVQADSGGGANTFAITTSALDDGTASFTATDSSADGTTTSPASNLLTATVAAPAPTGLHQVGTTANGGTVTIAGTGDAQGDTITLYKGTTASVANQIGTGTVGANGAFTATASLPDGSYTITATDTSADSTVTSAVSSPSTSVTLNTLYSFTAGSDGDTPQAGLIADAAGNLFGTTAGGASGNGGDYGTVFEITDTNGVYATTPTTLYSFSGGSDGGTPLAGLLTDAAGDLFGTTVNGGADGYGTVFEIADNNGTYATTPTTLYSFTGGDDNDGAVPAAGLFVDGAGNLLGTTLSGGFGYGTVFEIAKNGDGTYATSPSTLYRFTGNSDGANPYAGLIADAAGDLFGTTANGANGYGTVFEIANTSGSASAPAYATTPTLLYSFTGGAGGNPEASLIADAAGNLYGTTASGGVNGDGTVFEIAKNSDGTYAATPTTLVSFNGTDGSTPKAGLIADTGGNLYGTTTGGGAYGNSNGEIFEVVKNADGSFAATPTVLHSFDGTDGNRPQASVLLTASGTLLGTTGTGGANGAGTVFALTSQANQPTAIVTATVPTGLAQKGTTTPGGPIEITGTGDASGDTITIYNGTTVVGSGTAGTGGAFDITTTADFATGSYTLTATNTSADGTETSAGAAVTATVAAGTPTANAQSDAVGFNTATPITLTGSDPDTPPLTLTYAIATGPAHGTLSGTGANETYTPTSGYQGADSFTFTDSNGSGSGSATSAPATVSLTIAAGAPTANAQSDAVAFNTAKAITLTGTDPDSPALPLTYAIASGPAHGTLSGSGANETYTPVAGYQGSDSFTFTDSNGSVASAPATVSLTVAAGTPTANAQSDAVAFNTAKAITLTGTDPDSPALPLTYAIASGPAHGTLSGSGANETYTPVAGYQGSDSFTFTDSNGSVASAPATVSLTVAAGTPTANAQSDAVGFNTAKAITLTGTDPDSPALPLTYAIASGPAHGTLSGSGANETYTPTAGYQGADSFTFTDSNGSGSGSATSAPATVSLTIAAGAPTANAQSDAVAFHTATAITLTGNDPDSPALPLTYTIATGPAHGTLSGSGANETYTPTAGYQGADSFTFTDSNGANTSAPATVSLTVAPPPLVITAPAAGSSVSIIDPTISGMTGASGAGSTITLTSGQTVLGSTIVAGDGSWSDTIMLPTDGSYTIVATDTVNGINQGSASDTFTLNSTPNEPLFGMTTYDATSAGGQVYALYETILGRAPDAVGLENFTAASNSGTPLATIAQDLIVSAEYASDYGSSTQSNAAFVNQLYEDGLHRAVDSSGGSTWVSALDNGSLTRGQVAVGIATSQESQNDLAPTFQSGVFVPDPSDAAVARLYYGLFGRAPDASGLQGWEGAVAGGTSITQVAQDFLATPEYETTVVGQSNLQFVEGLYQSALGRSGDPSGVQTWEVALDTGSQTRAGVALDFLTSAEFTNDEAGQSNTSFVSTLYQAALGRPADANGEQGWVNALNNGSLTRTQVAQDFVASQEFQTNVTAPGQASFVNALYEGALGRGADAAGLQGWDNALSSGASPASVAVGITQSSEAQTHLAPKIEAGFHLA